MAIQLVSKCSIHQSVLRCRNAVGRFSLYTSSCIKEDAPKPLINVARPGIDHLASAANGCSVPERGFCPWPCRLVSSVGGRRGRKHLGARA